MRVRVFCKPLLFISGVTSSYGKILFQCTSVKGAEQLHLQRAILRNKVTEQEEEVKLEGQGKAFQLIIHKRKLSKLTCGEYLLLLYPEEGAELRVSALREEKELWKGVNEKKGWDIKLPGKNQVSLKVDKKNVAYISIREKGRPEGFLDKWKVTCAKLLAKIYRRVQKEPVWLIGEEMGMMAQDNGYAFFQYCIKEKKKPGFGQGVCRQEVFCVLWFCAAYYASFCMRVLYCCTWDQGCNASLLSRWNKEQ